MVGKEKSMKDEAFVLNNIQDALKAFKEAAESIDIEYKKCTKKIIETRKKQTQLKHKYSYLYRIINLLEEGKTDKALSVIRAYNRRASYYK